MAKQYFLRFLITGEQDLIFEVREPVWDRLREIMTTPPPSAAPLPFFWFDAVNGRSIVINLAFVQGVRFLWEVAAGPADLVRGEEGIHMHFRDGSEVVEEYSEDPEDWYWVFMDLESSLMRCPSFTDQDGEMMILVPEHLLYITAPTHLLQEGRNASKADE